MSPSLPLSASVHTSPGLVQVSILSVWVCPDQLLALPVCGSTPSLLHLLIFAHTVPSTLSPEVICKIPLASQVTSSE